MRQDQPEPACGDMLGQSLVTRNALSKSGFGNNENDILFLNGFSYDPIKTPRHPRAGIIVRAVNIQTVAREFRQQFQGESFLFNAEIFMPQPLPERSAVEDMGQT